MLIEFITITPSWAMEGDKEFSQSLVQSSVKVQEDQKGGNSSTIVCMNSKDVLFNIFSFLDPYELLNLARVSKPWKKASELELLWKPYGVPTKEKFKDLYKKENIFNAVEEIMKEEKPFYTHHYIDQYYLPDKIILLGTRNFSLAEGQQDFLKEIVFLTFQKIFSRFFMNIPDVRKSPEVIRNVMKCISIQAFEKNASNGDKDAYRLPLSLKFDYGVSLNLIRNTNSPKNEINQFVEYMMARKKDIFNQRSTSNPPGRLH